MIPVWNELTQSYELPPNVYYGFPFPFVEVVFLAVLWLIIVALTFYIIKNFGVYTSCIFAAGFGSFIAALAFFRVWYWEMNNIIWNVTPQFNYLAAFVFFLIISAVIHAAGWFAVVKIHRWNKLGREAE